jgi:cell division protein FtsQ
MIHPWHNVALLRIASSWLAMLALFLCVGGLGVWLTQLSYFQISRIDVAAASGYSIQQFDQHLLKTLRAQPITGGLFRANLSNIKQLFEQAPWVRKANVRRVWPNRLLVEIEEHQAVAVWDDGRLVNHLGELFVANSAVLDNEDQLPSLQGPAGTHFEVSKRWQEMSRWLAPLGVKPVQVELSDRHAWKITLDNRTVLLLGRDTSNQIQERVERMVQVLPEVVERLGAMPRQIDLRYPSGFAVKAAAVNADGTSPLQNNNKNDQG